MSRYALSHLSDPILDRELPAAIAQERTSTAVVLAHIAEFDARAAPAAGRAGLGGVAPGVVGYGVGRTTGPGARWGGLATRRGASRGCSATGPGAC